MLGGLSHCFHNVQDIRKAYLQACYAIAMGRKIGGAAVIFDYKKMKFYQMLDLLYDKVGGDLRQFCSPTLLDIIDYDEKYNTQLAYTAYLFIRCDKNPTKTSKSLGIHRNTVDYRINKISDLFGIDLRNQEITFSLDLSFRILEYLRELPC
jgi:purine catabolism regulator